MKQSKRIVFQIIFSVFGISNLASQGCFEFALIDIESPSGYSISPSQWEIQKSYYSEFVCFDSNLYVTILGDPHRKPYTRVVFDKSSNLVYRFYYDSLAQYAFIDSSQIKKLEAGMSYADICFPMDSTKMIHGFECRLYTSSTGDKGAERQSLKFISPWIPGSPDKNVGPDMKPLGLALETTTHYGPPTDVIIKSGSVRYLPIDNNEYLSTDTDGFTLLAEKEVKEYLKKRRLITH